MSLTNVPRVLSRLWSCPPGHVWVVVGSFSALAPLCLALLNGGQSSDTDTIVPKEEIGALFRHRQFVQLQAWDPNPQLTKLPHAEPLTKAEGAQQSQTDGQEGQTADPAANGAGVGGSGKAQGGVSDGGDGLSASPASMALFSVLSWKGSEEEDSDAAVRRSAEERAMQRWSRQRSHVQGQRTAVPPFTGLTSSAPAPAPSSPRMSVAG